MPFGEESLRQSMGMSGVASVQNLCLRHMVCMWNFIRSGWLNFSKFLCYDVGDGTQVKFWDDVRCRDHPLNESFPDLHNISSTRDAFGLGGYALLKWENILGLTVSSFNE